METIQYNNLSSWLKVLVIYGFIMFGLTAISFLIGFFEELLYY